MKTKVFISTIIIFTLAAVLQHELFSQCITPFEAGNWTNIDLSTRGITHINVNFSCNDVVLCGVDQNGNVTCQPPPPPFQVHLWGKCHPSDCDWSTASGNVYIAPDGTHWIYIYYDQGFAKRYVYLKPSALFPGDLFMWMYTDFSDPGRADYVMRNWFHH
jgi:hypothetical protein